VRDVIPERHVRAAWSLPIFASAASVAFAVAAVFSPHGASPAEAALAPAFEPEAQTFALEEGGAEVAGRDDYAVIEKKPDVRTPPAVGAPDPGTAQAIAYDMVMARGWSQGEFDCLVALWNRESHWNVYAHNPRSGAYGIPQALPGSKMASAGADWATNPATQITWGLGYIAGRYGTPCNAWQSSETRGWY
jgi:hypothetical protein